MTIESHKSTESIICQKLPIASTMKMKMILLVLGLAMIQDQTLAASKHHLVETKHKHYLVETKGKTQVGKGAEKKFLLLTFIGLDSTVDTFK